MVAKVEWHPGELYPRVGFIVSNLTRPAARVVAFDIQRGTAEQWIKEGKGAIEWTRLACRSFGGAARAERVETPIVEDQELDAAEGVPRSRCQSPLPAAGRDRQIMLMTSQSIAEIPVFEVGLLPSADLCRQNLDRVRNLIDEALSRRSHLLLPLATRLLDQVSHSWLVRQASPYLEEIRQVASAVGQPGAYFLNTIYEWACSTSAAPDPGGPGARMIRVLDWGLSGIGAHVVIARHETRHGAFLNPTWPGYAGVVTAMAPGRFAAAINQGPRMPVLGINLIDGIVTHLQVLAARDAVPAAHLLRRTFEDAADFERAVEILSDEAVAIAMPALFVIAGVEHEHCCVVEAWGSKRRVHYAGTSAPLGLGVANQWLSPDLAGRARTVPGATTHPEVDNLARRTIVTELQRGAFNGASDLPEPVINRHTVMVVTANAREGEMTVEALDSALGQSIPCVVARRTLCEAPTAQ